TRVMLMGMARILLQRRGAAWARASAPRGLVRVRQPTGEITEGDVGERVDAEGGVECELTGSLVGHRHAEEAGALGGEDPVRRILEGDRLRGRDSQPLQGDA